MHTRIIFVKMDYKKKKPQSLFEITNMQGVSSNLCQRGLLLNPYSIFHSRNESASVPVPSSALLHSEAPRPGRPPSTSSPNEQDLTPSTNSPKEQDLTRSAPSRLDSWWQCSLVSSTAADLRGSSRECRTPSRMVSCASSSPAYPRRVLVSRAAFSQACAPSERGMILETS